jgi:hypothetical protein
MSWGRRAWRLTAAACAAPRCRTQVGRWEAFIEPRLAPGQAVVRLVGLHVVPLSLSRPCDLGSRPQQALGDVAFSYSVYWLPSHRPWARRCGCRGG